MEDLPTTAGNDILVENAGGGVMFKEIGDERTFNGILNQITDNIQSGRLKAGDALPAERTMAETMGVSRPAVREALRALELLGIIKPVPGGGNYIADDLDSWLIGPLSILFKLNNSYFRQNQQLRAALEREMAILAARKCTPLDAAELLRILTQIDSAEDEIRRGELDKELHTKIAKIADNPMIYSVLAAADQLTDNIISGTREYIMQKNMSAAEIDEQHRRLVEAIINNDDKLAELCMSEHMDTIQLRNAWMKCSKINRRDIQEENKMDYAKESLRLHKEWKGKIEVVTRVPAENKEDLSLAYTPGVAQPCLEIQKDINKSYELTRRWNMCLVVTDGSAILGLGNIGPEAGMPVMEGKCALFKAFGDVDAFPLCIKSNDVDEIVNTIYLISGSFGGINLEDISAPRCFEIEKKLKEKCDIPVFHDDQHGTAIVVAAGLTNALRYVHKEFSEAKVVINGAGSAGISICRLLLELGIGDVVLVDRNGILAPGEEWMNPAQKEMAEITNKERLHGDLKTAMKGRDIFVGVSAPNIVTSEMVSTMADDAIVFAMANPTPEIMPDEAKKGGAKVVATGRSDFPNQINNVLVFPGVFRGAFDVRASDINEEMKIAASKAIAALISDEELSADNIIPKAFDKRVGPAVAKAVAEAAGRTGVARI